MANRPTLFTAPRPAIALLVLAAWLRPVAASAHPGLDEGIARLSAQISAQSDGASLYLQRADLHRQHAEFDAALADLADVARLKPGATSVLLARARVFSDAGQTTNALRVADEFLAVESNNPEGFVLRARCRFKLNQAGGAVEDFTAAIAKASPPEPDLYLERARAQAALGQIPGAVKGLDEGVTRLGEVPALQMAAIEYERQRAAFTNALARVDKLLAGAPVKEPWLVLRGEILAQSGRLDEARAAFQRVFDGIENYPPARRNLELTRRLETRTRENLARIQARQLLVR